MYLVQYDLVFISIGFQLPLSLFEVQKHFLLEKKHNEII